MSGCLHFDEGRRWIRLSEMKSASAETCRPFTFYLRIEASLLASEAVVALACRERGVSTKACSSVSTMPAPGSRDCREIVGDGEVRPARSVLSSTDDYRDDRRCRGL